MGGIDRESERQRGRQIKSERESMCMRKGDRKTDGRTRRERVMVREKDRATGRESVRERGRDRERREKRKGDIGKGER